MSRRRTAGFWLALGMFAALPLMACGGGSENSPDSQEGASVGSQPLSEEAQELVSQGNAAQREGRYDEALRLFGQALELHPNHPVPQFGSLMAATAVGDTALARSMRERLATSGPELLEMLGPGGAMGGAAPGGANHLPPGAMPPGHPDIGGQTIDTVLPPTGASG